MAYGNWGAWVYRDGERMPQWEDQTPYREEDQESGYHQAFSRSDSGLSPHHAVLGGREVRFCGYKNHPALFVRFDEIDLDPFKLPSDERWGDDEWIGEVEGFKFHAQQFDGNMIDLELVEPDGTRWTARCGYCYGAGWMDDDAARDRAWT